jgi:hypothetical protein
MKMAEYLSLFNIVIGTMIALFASLTSSLGVNIQAYALQRKRLMNSVTEDDDDFEYTLSDQPSSSRWTNITPSMKWNIGFALYVSAQLFGSICALTYITPLIYAPLGASGLIFNILWSRYLFVNSDISLGQVSQNLICLARWRL